MCTYLTNVTLVLITEHKADFESLYFLFLLSVINANKTALT